MRIERSKKWWLRKAELEEGMSAGLPRRVHLELLSPAETAIRDAVLAVEALPADVRLTDAVILLQQARDKVADFVDEQQKSADPGD